MTSLDLNQKSSDRLPCRTLRRTLQGLVLLPVVAVSYFVIAQWWVTSVAAGRIYHRIEEVPEAPVAVVFGARVYPDGTLSPVLDARVKAAVELYRAGKVRKLLMTGDNGDVRYDEVTAMKRRAVALGVPAQDVVRDYAGFRTYDSCYRAREIFGVDRAVLVTQEFHLNRAVFLARRLGIQATGFIAPAGMPDAMLRKSERREVLARSAAVADTVLQRRPRYLGPREPLFGNEGPGR